MMDRVYFVKKNMLKYVLLGVIFAATSIGSYEQNTSQDQQVARDLIQESIALKGQTQSHSHLNVKFVQQKMMQATGLARHQEIIEQALAREVEVAKQGYVVFYTAVPYMRLFQDVTRKEYQAVVGRIGALQEKAFQFVRYNYNDPVYMQYKNVNDFLIQEITKEGIVDDNIIRLKTILVSTNLAFFGNMGFTGESTYHYFNNPQPWASANPEWLKQSLVSFGYSTQFVDELMQLAQDIVTDTGDLFQIFIPKDLINQIGYLSWRQGIPFDIEFINSMFVGKPVIIKNEQGQIIKEFTRDKMTFGRGDALFSAEINQRIADYKAQYAAGDPTIVAMTNYMLGNIRQGKYHLIPFLDVYKQGVLPYTNFYQARLLIGPWLLDPTRGLKIYRYSTLDKAREQKYKQGLKDIFNRMEQERRQRLGLPIEQQEMPIANDITMQPIAVE